MTGPLLALIPLPLDARTLARLAKIWPAAVTGDPPPWAPPDGQWLALYATAPTAPPAALPPTAGETGGIIHVGR